MPNPWTISRTCRLSLSSTHWPNTDRQLLGGIRSPLSLYFAGRQMYQSLFGFSRLDLLSLNQGCYEMFSASTC